MASAKGRAAGFVLSPSGWADIFWTGSSSLVHLKSVLANRPSNQPHCSRDRAARIHQPGAAHRQLPTAAAVAATAAALARSIPTAICTPVPIYAAMAAQCHANCPADAVHAAATLLIPLSATSVCQLQQCSARGTTAAEGGPWARKASQGGPSRDQSSQGTGSPPYAKSRGSPPEARRHDASAVSCQGMVKRGTNDNE